MEVRNIFTLYPYICTMYSMYTVQYIVRTCYMISTYTIDNTYMVSDKAHSMYFWQTSNISPVTFSYLCVPPPVMLKKKNKHTPTSTSQYPTALYGIYVFCYINPNLYAYIYLWWIGIPASCLLILYYVCRKINSKGEQYYMYLRLCEIKLSPITCNIIEAANAKICLNIWHEHRLIWLDYKLTLLTVFSNLSSLRVQYTFFCYAVNKVSVWIMWQMIYAPYHLYIQGWTDLIPTSNKFQSSVAAKNYQ